MTFAAPLLKCVRWMKNALPSPIEQANACAIVAEAQHAGRVPSEHYGHGAIAPCKWHSSRAFQGENSHSRVPKPIEGYSRPINAIQGFFGEKKIV